MADELPGSAADVTNDCAILDKGWPANLSARREFEDAGDDVARCSNAFTARHPRNRAQWPNGV
jgi:hypothetical protein